MSRHVAWVQQRRRPALCATYGPTEAVKPNVPFDQLGLEVRTGEPVYDNGSFFIVDTIEDLVWAICYSDPRGSICILKTVELDKYEAIRVADELKEAEARA